MPVTGPSFVALQVRDVDASARFYADMLGLRRAPIDRPGAVVFSTEPIPLAVREPLPGIDLDRFPIASGGVGLWLLGDDVDDLCSSLRRAGVPIVREPQDGPFGRNFTFRDPDGYLVTIHEQA